MHQNRETAKFLRAAVKTGLRMQTAAGPDKSGLGSDGVATLQRIKASLREETRQTIVNRFHKQWLSTVPWETVLTVNQALCQAKNTPHQPKDQASDKARQIWEQAIPQKMSLKEVLDVCRRCHELAPFSFNNGNTFAAIGKTLVEDWLQRLPPVEAQIIRTTVAHYIAGQVGKKELLQVLRHFETSWNMADETTVAAPAAHHPEAPASTPAPATSAGN